MDNEGREGDPGFGSEGGAGKGDQAGIRRDGFAGCPEREKLAVCVDERKREDKRRVRVADSSPGGAVAIGTQLRQQDWR